MTQDYFNTAYASLRAFTSIRAIHLSISAYAQCVHCLMNELRL